MAFYLITGGAGFIGSNIAQKLLNSGAKVRVLDNFSAGLSRDEFDSFFQLHRKNLDLIDGDVRDIETCRKAMDGVTHVLHHAAISSALESIGKSVETVAVNVVGTANLLTAASESGSVERFVNASSCVVYGDGSSSSKTESAMLYPSTPFATSMQAAESLCANFAKSSGLCAVSVRYFNVYGPSEITTGHAKSAVAKFIHAPLHKQDAIVYGTGSQTRDFIHIDDAFAAIMAVCECQLSCICGQVFNLGTGDKVSIIDLLDMVSSIGGWSIDCIAAEPRPHEMKHSKADILKASSLLGFQAKIPLEAGLSEMVAVATELRKAA